MSPLQFRDLCNESFELSAGATHGAELNQGIHSFVGIAPGEEKRIQMPFITLGMFNQPRYLPGRFLNLVLELELTPDAESWINTVNKGGKEFQYQWSLADCSILASTINLDPALDSMIADRILTGEIPMPIRTWTSQQQIVTNSDFNVTMTRGVSRLATVVMTYTKAAAAEDDQKKAMCCTSLQIAKRLSLIHI